MPSLESAGGALAAGASAGSSVGTEAGVSRVQARPRVAHAWMALATSVKTSRLGLCTGPWAGRVACGESQGVRGLGQGHNTPRCCSHQLCLLPSPACQLSLELDLARWLLPTPCPVAWQQVLRARAG